MDRVLASRLGHHAVNRLLEGEENVAIGVVNSNIFTCPFQESITMQKQPREALIRMASILAI